MNSSVADSAKGMASAILKDLNEEKRRAQPEKRPTEFDALLDRAFDAVAAGDRKSFGKAIRAAIKVHRAEEALGDQ